MGFSVSVASAILFIAASVVFSVLFGSIISFQNTIDDAKRVEMQQLQELKGTEIAISGVDVNNHTITVLNTGSIMLDPRAIDLLINGSMINISTFEVMNHAGSNIWLPGESVRLVTTSDLLDARIKVITENGIGAYW
jgi:archaellum component FlaF (FlaF/FlaG flagellin family)